MIFNVAESIPKGRVDYGGAEWLKLVTHAAREADRLGLELGIHNAPGWSSSGGPWITEFNGSARVYANGLQSFHIHDGDFTEFGPYFTADVKGLLDWISNPANRH